MQKILITGANGFIGANLVKQAKAMGHYPYAGIRKGADISLLAGTGVDFVYLDYEDIPKLTEVMRSYKFDSIIHNAGLTRSPSINALIKVNKDYLVNIIEAIRESGEAIEKLIYVSSLAAYGPADKLTTGMVDNSIEPKPVTNYGRSKLEAEKYLKSVTDIPWLIVRPTAVYGPGEKDLLTVFQMISKGIDLVAGYLPQKLTFVYGEDLARLMILMANSKHKHKAYFAGDGQIYLGSEFSKIIKRAIGRRVVKIKLPIPLIKSIAYLSENIGRVTNNYPVLNIDKVNEIKARNWSVDVSQTLEDFELEPRSLTEGVPATVKWYRDQKWL